MNSGMQTVTEREEHGGAENSSDVRLPRHDSPSSVSGPHPAFPAVSVAPQRKRDLLTLFDLQSSEVRALIEAAAELKTAHAMGERLPILARRVIALLFEKPSLRTRVSFESAMAQLGGNSIYLGNDCGWGGRESIPDFARALSRYVDAIIFRGGEQSICELLAEHSRCSLINGLTRQFHPCQALADALAVRERFASREDIRVAYVGDGNNVAASFATVCGHLGLPITMASPPGYELKSDFLELWARHFPRQAFSQVTDPRDAVAGAHVVYTDVWTSMGDESEEADRLRVFPPYQVNASLMRLADPEAIIMHCLPARRGEEITNEVLDSPQSVVFDQAENRLHMHKAILVWLIHMTREDNHGTS